MGSTYSLSWATNLHLSACMSHFTSVTLLLHCLALTCWIIACISNCAEVVKLELYVIYLQYSISCLVIWKLLFFSKFRKETLKFLKKTCLCGKKSWNEYGFGQENRSIFKSNFIFWSCFIVISLYIDIYILCDLIFCHEIKPNSFKQFELVYT